MLFSLLLLPLALAMQHGGSASSASSLPGVTSARKVVIRAPSPARDPFCRDTACYPGSAGSLSHLSSGSGAGLEELPLPSTLLRGTSAGSETRSDVERMESLPEEGGDIMDEKMLKRARRALDKRLVDKETIPLLHLYGHVTELQAKVNGPPSTLEELSLALSQQAPRPRVAGLSKEWDSIVDLYTDFFPPGVTPVHSLKEKVASLRRAGFPYPPQRIEVKSTIAEAMGSLPELEKLCDLDLDAAEILGKGAQGRVVVADRVFPEGIEVGEDVPKQVAVKIAYFSSDEEVKAEAKGKEEEMVNNLGLRSNLETLALERIGQVPHPAIAQPLLLLEFADGLIIVQELAPRLVLRDFLSIDPALRPATFGESFSLSSQLPAGSSTSSVDASPAPSTPRRALPDLRGEPLMEEVSQQITSILAPALDHLHNWARVAHADLKLENIMLDFADLQRLEDGVDLGALSRTQIRAALLPPSSEEPLPEEDRELREVLLRLAPDLSKISALQLVDFGCAYLFDEHQKMYPFKVRGTVGYLPKQYTMTRTTEVLRDWHSPLGVGNHVRVYPPFLDIYALGSMLYTLIHGRHTLEQQGNLAIAAYRISSPLEELLRTVLTGEREVVPAHQVKPGQAIMDARQLRSHPWLGLDRETLRTRVLANIFEQDKIAESKFERLKLRLKSKQREVCFNWDQTVDEDARRLQEVNRALYEALEVGRSPAASPGAQSWGSSSGRYSGGDDDFVSFS